MPPKKQVKNKKKPKQKQRQKQKQYQNQTVIINHPTRRTTRRTTNNVSKPPSSMPNITNIVSYPANSTNNLREEIKADISALILENQKKNALVHKLNDDSQKLAFTSQASQTIENFPHTYNEEPTFRKPMKISKVKTRSPKRVIVESTPERSGLKLVSHHMYEDDEGTRKSRTGKDHEHLCMDCNQSFATKATLERHKSSKGHQAILDAKQKASKPKSISARYLEAINPQNALIGAEYAKTQHPFDQQNQVVTMSNFGNKNG